MTEEELLLGITQALTIAGWRWHHLIRSDGITSGDVGLPDIIAVHPTRGQMLAWELKGDRGKPTGDQVAWIAAFAGVCRTNLDARILYPPDYDRALAWIVGKEWPVPVAHSPELVTRWRDHLGEYHGPE